MNEDRKYQIALPYLKATARCFLSHKAYRAFEYAISEPSDLIFVFLDDPDYPDIEKMVAYLRAPLAVRRKAIYRAAAAKVSNAQAISLFQDLIEVAVAFGRAGWTLRKAQDEFVKLLQDRYDEVVNTGNRRFWPKLYERGAILQTDEVGVDIVSYLYEILMGRGKLNLHTRSKELSHILELDSEDFVTITRKIIGLLKAPKCAETQRAATIMLLDYLEEKYRVNKERSKSAIKKAISEGIYYKAHQIRDKLTGEIVEEDIADQRAEDDFSAVDNLLLYRDAMQIITDPKDRTSMELAMKHILGELTDEEYELEAARQNLNPSKIEDRLRYLPKKYPRLASLN